jgi:hypothetical protein
MYRIFCGRLHPGEEVSDPPHHPLAYDADPPQLLKVEKYGGQFDQYINGKSVCWPTHGDWVACGTTLRPTCW